VKLRTEGIVPNVADKLVEMLEAAGVKRVYGVMGDSLNIRNRLKPRACSPLIFGGRNLCWAT
jgi:hypothetical protein